MTSTSKTSQPGSRLRSGSAIVVLLVPLAPVTMKSGKSGTGSRSGAVEDFVAVAFECGVGTAGQAEGFLWRLRGWRHRGSGAVERFGIGEHAAHPGVVLGKNADLKVRPPLRPWRSDLVDGAELESEPSVVGRVAEQRDQRLTECVGRAQDGVHERAADAGVLVVRTDGQRAEGDDGVLTDMPSGAEDVADRFACEGDRDQGQGREPGGAGPEFVDQPGLGHDLAWRPAWAERGVRNGADDVGVALGLTSDQHAVTMTRRRPRMQPDFAMIPATILDGRIDRPNREFSNGTSIKSSKPHMNQDAQRRPMDRYRSQDAQR